ncbi:MAG: hypothetical protein ACHQUC_02200 [Chlamydiales bacterium]
MSNPIDKLNVTCTHFETINRSISEKKYALVISDKNKTKYEVVVYDSLIQKRWAYFIGFFTPGKNYLHRSEAKPILILQLKREFEVFAKENSLNTNKEIPSLKFIMKTLGESNESNTLKKIGDYQSLISRINELFTNAQEVDIHETTAKVSSALNTFSHIVSTTLVIKDDIRKINIEIDLADGDELSLIASELSVLRGRAAAIKKSISQEDHAEILATIQKTVQKLQDRQSSGKAQAEASKVSSPSKETLIHKAQPPKAEVSTIEITKNKLINSLREIKNRYLFLSSANAYHKNLTDLSTKPDLSKSEKEKIDESIKELESVIKEKFDELFNKDNLIEMKIILSEAKKINNVGFLKNLITDNIINALTKMFEGIDENRGLEHLQELVWVCKDFTVFEELSGELNGFKQKLNVVLDDLTREIELEQQKLSEKKPTLAPVISDGNASAAAEKLVGSIKDSYFKNGLNSIYNSIDDLDSDQILSLNNLEKECLSDLKSLEHREKTAPISQLIEDRQQTKRAIDSLKTLHDNALEEKANKKKFAESTKTYNESMRKFNDQKSRIDGIRTELSK